VLLAGDAAAITALGWPCVAASTIRARTTSPCSARAEAARAARTAFSVSDKMITKGEEITLRCAGYVNQWGFV
jgi:hypothetical protein